MRETCLFCVSKHISKAIILVAEAMQGYPMHLWLAVGNLSEAEDESACEYNAFATKIRKCRLALMGQEGQFKVACLMELLEEARGLAEVKNGILEVDRIAQVLENAKAA